MTATAPAPIFQLHLHGSSCSLLLRVQLLLPNAFQFLLGVSCPGEQNDASKHQSDEGNVTLKGSIRPQQKAGIEFAVLAGDSTDLSHGVLPQEIAIAVAQVGQSDLYCCDAAWCNDLLPQLYDIATLQCLRIGDHSIGVVVA